MTAVKPNGARKPVILTRKYRFHSERSILFDLKKENLSFIAFIIFLFTMFQIQENKKSEMKEILSILKRHVSIS